MEKFYRMMDKFYSMMKKFYTMMRTFYVCIEHSGAQNIMVSNELLWCQMNYYRDDELNYGYVIIILSIFQHLILLLVLTLDCINLENSNWFAEI